MGLQAVLRGHGPYRGCRRGAIDGAKIWWVAPSYPVAKNIIWPDLKRACRNAWVDKREDEHHILLPSGGSVTVKSGDNPDGLRGIGLDGLVLDEAAFLRASVWREVLRPTLSDRNGWAIFISTPNGHNWFHEMFESAAGEADWERWQLPTSDNPLIPAEELEAARKDIGLRAYAQEFGAQFTHVAGAEFDPEYFHEGIWFDRWPDGGDIVWKCIALDPSKGKSEKSDYSAFVLLARDGGGTMYVDADLQNDRDPRRIVVDALAHYRQFQPHAFFVETNQFQEVLAEQMYDLARQQGIELPLHGENNQLNKVTRIRATITPCLANGSLRFLRGSRGAKLLVDQLRAFPVKGVHDDGPDALEMAIRLSNHMLQGGERSQVAFDHAYA